MESRRQEEIQVQASVLKSLTNSDDPTIMQLVHPDSKISISQELRWILNDFYQQHSRVPSSDELIWIVGVHHGLDPRDMKSFLRNLEKCGNCKRCGLYGRCEK